MVLGPGEYSGADAPRRERLLDVLVDMLTPERERLTRSEVKQLDYLIALSGGASGRRRNADGQHQDAALLTRT
jgi:hypothetical protein